MAVPRPDRPRRPPPPLDRAALERLALRYVERFQTTRAKLIRYLGDKVRARGWADDRAADPAAVADRFVTLGYVDDRAFAQAKAGAMTRRGLGAARVRGALREAGIGGDDTAAVQPALDEGRAAAALAFARRRRIGPWAAAPADRALREKQVAAMVRGGHDFVLARALVGLEPGADPADALAPLGLETPAC